MVLATTLTRTDSLQISFVSTFTLDLRNEHTNVNEMLGILDQLNV